MVECKTDRIAKEFQELPKKNNKLYNIILLLSSYIYLEFRKPLTLTEIFRTPQENTSLYKATIASGGVEPTWKPHTQWLAVDIRSTTFTDSEIKKLLTFLNCITVFNGQRKCAVYHTIKGNVAHFHIQAENYETN